MLIFSGIFRNTAVEIDVLNTDIRALFPISGILYTLIQLLHFKLIEIGIYDLPG